MYNLCTLSDNKYLLKGIVLYDSLHKKNLNFILHYLCLDDKIYNNLRELNFDKIKLYRLNELLDTDKELRNARSTLTYSNFCWSMASYFCKFLMEKGKCEDILYIDSDIVFYQPIDDIYREIGNKSIGIIRHRNVPNGHFVGEFNVGIVFFKNDDPGISCCNFWWDLVSGKNLEYKEYGTCGDQKYLELFPLIYNEHLCIIDDIVGHAAPFNFHLYDYSLYDKEDKKIIYNNKVQKIIFCHFMKFIPFFDKKSYQSTNEPNNPPPFHINAVKEMYDEYYLYNEEMYNKYIKK